MLNVGYKIDQAINVKDKTVHYLECKLDQIMCKKKNQPAKPLYTVPVPFCKSSDSHIIIKNMVEHAYTKLDECVPVQVPIRTNTKLQNLIFTRKLHQNKMSDVQP